MNRLNGLMLHHLNRLGQRTAGDLFDPHLIDSGLSYGEAKGLLLGELGAGSNLPAYDRMTTRALDSQIETEEFLANQVFETPESPRFDFVQEADLRQVAPELPPYTPDWVPVPEGALVIPRIKPASPPVPQKLRTGPVYCVRCGQSNHGHYCVKCGYRLPRRAVLLYRGIEAEKPTEGPRLYIY